MTFVLAHSLVYDKTSSRSSSSEGALAGEPGRKAALVLHGALGSGQNFRGFVRKLLERRPDYCFVLVDLRNHGKSHPAPPPQTLLNAARDLEVLTSDLAQAPEQWRISCVIGHSLGGKVALEYGRSFAPELEQIWALDSDPGTQSPEGGHEILEVVRAVRAVSQPIHRRSDVVDSLIAQGLSSGLANWMTTNIERSEDGYRFSFDLDAIEELVADYFQQDLWPYLEGDKARARRPQLHVVVAENSNRFDAEMRGRLSELSLQGRIELHRIPDAGHWLHVDNPDALLHTLAEGLV